MVAFIWTMIPPTGIPTYLVVVVVADVTIRVHTIRIVAAVDARRAKPTGIPIHIDVIVMAYVAISVYIICMVVVVDIRRARRNSNQYSHYNHHCRHLDK